MILTSPSPGTARAVVTAIVLVVGLALLTLLFRLGCSEPRELKVLLANETARVDYEDGVSCYHRRGGISCVFVPSRAPMGPVAPAVLVEDIVEPNTNIIPTSKKRSRK